MSYSVNVVGDMIWTRPLVSPPSVDGVIDRLVGASHCFANLETPLTTCVARDDKLVCIKAPPSLAVEIKSRGIDIVNIANNHLMDFGADGLRETMASLSATGLEFVGGGVNLDESYRPVIVESDGCRVAYLGMTTTLANSSAAGKQRPGAAPVRILTRYLIDPVTLQETPGMSPHAETIPFDDDVSYLAERIRAAAKEADLVIVAAHWGVPYGWVASIQSEIAGYQRPLAHAMIDAGASAIIGHHPHVLQGVEFYRDRPIFYSLGNFIIHPDRDRSEMRSIPEYDFGSLRGAINKIGGLAKLSWASTEGRPKCELWPVNLDANGEPQWATPAQCEVALARMTVLPKGVETRVSTRRDAEGHQVLEFAPG